MENTMKKDPYNYAMFPGMGELAAKPVVKKPEPLKKIYVRYQDGAEMYSMSRHSFMKLAMEAGAVRKINHMSLVNTKIFEEYIETFAI